MSVEVTVMTFNIHKGFSLFNRHHTLPAIKRFLEHHHPDLVFLQEVRGLHLKGPIENQMEHLADSLWTHSAYGKNAVSTEAHHGNAILSRYPFDVWENKDVSLNPLERRGILYGRILFGAEAVPIHTFCLHLNLLGRDRMRQSRMLLEFIEQKVPENEPVIVAGDFNDWSGEVTKLLSTELLVIENRDPRHVRTFPSFFPIFALDRIFTRHIHPISVATIRDPEWDGLSDHLPLMARMTVG